MSPYRRIDPFPGRFSPCLSASLCASFSLTTLPVGGQEKGEVEKSEENRKNKEREGRVSFTRRRKESDIEIEGRREEREREREEERAEEEKDIQYKERRSNTIEKLKGARGVEARERGIQTRRERD